MLVRLYEGATFSEIAQDLGVAGSTVRNLASRAYRRLGARNQYDASRKHHRLPGHVCHHLRLQRGREATI